MSMCVNARTQRAMDRASGVYRLSTGPNKHRSGCRKSVRLHPDLSSLSHTTTLRHRGDRERAGATVANFARIGQTGFSAFAQARTWLGMPAPVF